MSASAVKDNLLSRLLGRLKQNTGVEERVASAVSGPSSNETLAYVYASTDSALKRVLSRALPVSTVIDVGASNGMWSDVAMKHLPDAEYLLIEAQNCHKSDLESFCTARKNSRFVLAAAGDAQGEIYFDSSDPFGGVASKAQTDWAAEKVPLTTVDFEVNKYGLKPPFLLKLDTHGFEVPIIEGAEATLQNTNLVVIETYNFRILGDSLLFYEMCEFMKNRGFGVIDISEPLWRDYDKSFWQIDLFFIPLSRPEFAYSQYK